MITFEILKQYYEKELLPNSLNLALISLHYNKREYSIVMEGLDDRINAQFHNPKVTGYSLTFDKVGATDNKEFTLKLNHKFQMPSSLDKKDYYKLRYFFEIPYNRNATTSFTLLTFINEIDGAFQFANYSQYSRIYKTSKFKLPDPNAVYFKGLKNWDKINRLSSGKDKHVTLTNRHKTSILLPDLYSKIKDENISVIYTPNETGPRSEQQLIQQKLRKDS
ncbi:hypothetical protein C5Z25_01720 [Lactobacillus sp. CBA3605]|uniref:DUF6037 family protein n=1 Tax=Lactobacillus sp. CBA3605 TaxID=2099788 RepID=UPI000CFDCA06|nr:DUF6037 family protein [Lactobacillus sp. CBA3605]AVK60565.1 hypothetical protein C5Z25_01720 [Lactobacillus sp. CBA3605]